NARPNSSLELTRGPFLGSGEKQLHSVTLAAPGSLRGIRRSRQPACRGRPALGARAQLSVGVGRTQGGAFLRSVVRRGAVHHQRRVILGERKISEVASVRGRSSRYCA